MGNATIANAIPKDIALQLCAEIRQENRGKWYSLDYWQCWGCTKFSRGNPECMCMNSQAGCRGCKLINARFDRQVRTAIT